MALINGKAAAQNAKERIFAKLLVYGELNCLIRKKAVARLISDFRIREDPRLKIPKQTTTSCNRMRRRARTKARHRRTTDALFIYEHRAAQDSEDGV